MALLVCGPYLLARKPSSVLGAVFAQRTVSVWYEVPQVNKCHIVLWCVNDTRLSWLVATSGGLNNLRRGASQVDSGIYNAWSTTGV